MKRRSKKGSQQITAQSRKIKKLKRVSAQTLKLGDAALRDPLTETLRPYMTPKKYKTGDVVFHPGDLAKELFLVATGKFRITESDEELSEGRFFGELGFFAPRNQRTLTVECVEGGDILSITYEELRKLFLRKPEIGYYSLALSVAATMR